jgi:signal transduction histidine kinase
VFYEVIARVQAESLESPPPVAPRRLGFVRARRTLSGPQASGVISGLIGNGALVALGNRKGGLWTDLMTVVPAPPIDPTSSGLAEYRAPDREIRMGAVAVILRTPWAVWVEFPQSVVLAPAKAFLRRMIAIAFGFILMTAVLAHLLSARLTRPLEELTQASETIAGGHYSQRVATGRRDELGRLGVAFNTMTAQVEEVHRDLEERVHQRTAQLEAAVQQLEAFSYSVSHDLRAPLRAITGFSRILIDEHQAALPNDAAAYLRRVADGAQQMGRLIDDLLAFARLGRASVRRASTEPDLIVRSVLEDLRGDYAERDVQISVASLPPCEADPALLKQVYINLVSNALKFTRGRAAAQIRIGCESNGSGPVYFVKDNGVGFDMQYADKLFGVFQRLHRAEEYEGTGVGLAIVARVITRHGGRVWAESTPDLGASFFFTIGVGDDIGAL